MALIPKLQVSEPVFKRRGDRKWQNHARSTLRISLKATLLGMSGQKRKAKLTSKLNALIVGFIKYGSKNNECKRKNERWSGYVERKTHAIKHGAIEVSSKELILRFKPNHRKINAALVTEDISRRALEQ